MMSLGLNDQESSDDEEGALVELKSLSLSETKALVSRVQMAWILEYSDCYNISVSLPT